MQCPNCHVEYTKGDQYCQSCGAEVGKKSNSIVPVQTHLPAVLYNSPVPRSVAAGVGALAVGVGIELLRRNLLLRLQPERGLKGTLPALSNVKDLVFPQNNNKPLKVPKGYVVEETVVAFRRVIRRG